MQTNIDYEISQLRDAVFGEDVRSAFISCMEKLHTVSETNANIVIEAERTMNEIRDNAVNALNNLTSKLETGEFIGPPGPQGLPGEKGDTGKTGNTGERGSKWMRGTAITGIDSNGVEFPNSDIENALAGDFFINTSTNDIYECVKSGNPSTAKWAYIGNIKGNKGDRGDVGPQGTVENIDDQILTFELAENLENVKSGETVKIAFGKLMKAVGAFIVHHTQKATTSILGHIKITNSAAVTDSTGLALAATEKNAAISGTLAHQIAQISAQNNDFANNISQLNSNMAMVSASNVINGSADIVSDAYHTLCSFTLPVGAHLISATVSFPSNNTGFRRIGISADGKSFNMNRFSMEVRQAVNGNITTVFLQYVHVATNEDTLYLMAQQNSGITFANCAYGIRVLSVENVKRYTISREFLNTIY